MENKNNTSNFSRIVEADNQVVSEYKNDVYKLTYYDDLSLGTEPQIELKQNNTSAIIKQLILDIALTNNKLNLVMTLIDQFCYEGVIPEEVIHALEQTLNTEDRRNYKQK